MIKKKVLDLFCGCGGFSFGFSEAGYDIVLGIDYWNDALVTYQRNHDSAKTLLADLHIESPDEIKIKTGITDIDVVIGGPPCQGFSIAGKRIVDDERNKLYKSFVKFVDYYQPEAFMLENVPNIVSMSNGIIKDNIIKDFEDLGYAVVCKVLVASEFGVPQNRRRAFFVGIKGSKKFTFPKSTINKLLTSEEAISDLPENSLFDGCEYQIEAKSEYQEQLRIKSAGIYNHQITLHNQKTIEIISMVPDGGNYKNLPVELHQTRKVNIAWTRLNSQKPSFTIDTGHNHHFHYKFDRVPTVRESARLQSFPDRFVFLGTKTSQLKQVGNAVPPLLSETLATELLKQLKKE
jgi:DNA (cytosine-5)-methyltransferase 1